MTNEYFNRMYDWLRAGGKEIVADWLFNFPIERNTIPMRAPDTSSTAEALRQSRGPIEIAISEAVEDGLPGFRGGYVSVTATLKRLKQLGLRQPTAKFVGSIIEGMGYSDAGRAPRPFMQEDITIRSQLYHLMRGRNGVEYGRMQGYE